MKMRCGQNGFGLLSVLISIAVVGILAVFIARQHIQFSQSQSRETRDVLLEGLRFMVRNNLDCAYTLKQYPLCETSEQSIALYNKAGRQILANGAVHISQDLWVKSFCKPAGDNRSIQIRWADSATGPWVKDVFSGMPLSCMRCQLEVTEYPFFTETGAVGGYHVFQVSDTIENITKQFPNWVYIIVASDGSKANPDTYSQITVNAQVLKYQNPQIWTGTGKFGDSFAILGRDGQWWATSRSVHKKENPRYGSLAPDNPEGFPLQGDLSKRGSIGQTPSGAIHFEAKVNENVVKKIPSVFVYECNW